MECPLGPTISPPQDRTKSAYSPRAVLGRVLAVCVLAIACAGCVGITADDARLQNAIEDRWERTVAMRGLDVSPATAAVLTRQRLIPEAQGDAAATAQILESRLATQSEPDGALALAELSYHAGLASQTVSAATALAWYRDAAILGALAVGDPSCSQVMTAAEIHNRAVARLIRLAQRRRAREGETQNWQQVLEAKGLVVRGSSPYLAPERIGDLRVAGDFLVEGMDHVYKSPGLGVPLIAHRFVARDGPLDAQDRLYPQEMRIAATAVATPGGGLLGGAWRQTPGKLNLIDPFQHTSITIGDKDVALASDRTTPLAMQVARGHLAALEWTGLFDSNFEKPGTEAALFQMRPYQPGKIPLVFVHGLFSSPRAWVQTINELQNMPDIAARYQFWMFIYPTGAPIPGSALRLRQAMTAARDSLDPGHRDQALDAMVLVGHSMGGLLSKMMVQESGSTLWDAMITIPPDRFQAPAEIRESIGAVLNYRPLPFVDRVVFIATPHRGSPIADSRFGQAIAAIVRRPARLDGIIAELERLNGPDVVSEELRGRTLNAISNLRTDSAILAALDRIPIDPDVQYHSIIPLIGGTANTDGVVEYGSSHLAGAASERIVPGTHVSQQEPAVTRELTRILREHLAAVDSGRSAAMRR
jgi:pimeloyl-ACP methyl ester carboxylesterase